MPVNFLNSLGARLLSEGKSSGIINYLRQSKGPLDQIEEKEREREGEQKQGRATGGPRQSPKCK